MKNRILNFTTARRHMVFAGAAALLILGFAVALANASDPHNRAEIADVVRASALLGRPMPEVRASVPGLQRTAIGIDPIEAPMRAVHIGYAIDGRNMALLTVFKGTLAPQDASEYVDLPTGKAAVFTKTLDDGSADVAYVWGSNGLAYTLHVNVSPRVSREMADKLAASVR